MAEKKTLKQWREEKGLTQIALASKANVGLSTVVDCEAGRKLPRLDNAIKLVKALEIGLDDVAWNVESSNNS